MAWASILIWILILAALVVLHHYFGKDTISPHLHEERDNLHTTITDALKKATDHRKKL